MSCDGYSKTALMGNWYEERTAVPQAQRDEKEFRHLREEEDAISYISRKDLLLPLGRIDRAHPWNTSSVIVDDGFRQYKTMNKTQFDPNLIKNYQNYQDCRPVVKTGQQPKSYPEFHTSIQTSQSKNFALLNQTNMQRQVNEINREVKTNITDFGSTFKKHEPDHERFFALTTYQQFYDRKENPTAQETIDHSKLSNAAGYQGRTENAKGIKMTSTLTAEVFKSEKDPQQNTRVQRSWLPYVENAIKVAEHNIQKNDDYNSSTGFKTTDKLANYKLTNAQRLNYDIATSLPVADGEHVLKSKYMEPGAFRKVRSDVTMIRNQPITKK